MTKAKTGSDKQDKKKAESNGANQDTDSVDIKILKVLLKWRAWDKLELSKEELATELGYKSTKTKAFDEAFVRNKRVGHTEPAGPGKIRLTEAGIEAVGGEDALDPSDNVPPTNAEYQDRIMSMLEKPKAADVMKEMGDGKECTQFYLADALGYAHPNVHVFFYAFQELKKKNLVEKCGVLDRCQLWRLVDRFFPEGAETRSDAKLHKPSNYKKPSKKNKGDVKSDGKESPEEDGGEGSAKKQKRKSKDENLDGTGDDEDKKPKAKKTKKEKEDVSLEGDEMDEVSSSVPRVELSSAFKVSDDELKNSDNDDDTVPFS